MARKPHDDGPATADERPVIHRAVSSPAGRGRPGGIGVGSAPPEAGASPFEPARLVSSAERAPRDQEEDAALRPRRFDEFVGQRKIVDNMAVYVQAARRRGDALDHVLLAGPPGLGKTTLAFLLANEMGTAIHVTSGPALERKGDLAGILTSLQK